ncbi:uncharacterized protein [Physcomitrium patens]|uniref:uncharacterized protein isoform X2 n=1 Tax=Physcomitrium patens TaxID=3218 RepID=UPI003CCD0BAF
MKHYKRRSLDCTMKRCGNTSSRTKPTPRNLHPARTLANLNKGSQQKRKRVRNQTTGRLKGVRSTSFRTGKNKRRKQKPSISPRCEERRCRSVTSSSFESNSSNSCRKSRRSSRKERDDESCEPSCSMSGSFQDSIPGSKHVSPDASQANI